MLIALVSRCSSLISGVCTPYRNCTVHRLSQDYQCLTKQNSDAQVLRYSTGSRALTESQPLTGVLTNFGCSHQNHYHWRLLSRTRRTSSHCAFPPTPTQRTSATQRSLFPPSLPYYSTQLWQYRTNPNPNHCGELQELLIYITATNIRNMDPFR